MEGFFYERIREMLPIILHRYLRAPFLLHVEELQRPKRPRRTVVMLHGIGSSTLMWKAVAKALPDDVRIVAVDLLGFGKSPHPEWARYDASIQASSVIATLLRHSVPPGSIFIGHSLGALVAVELARKTPWYPRAIMLVSPPIYKPSKNRFIATQREDILRGIYKIMMRYPNNMDKALQLGKRYYVLLTKQPVAREGNIVSYLASLNASIVNQSTIDHIGDLKHPIRIISGALDPLVITRNLQRIAAKNDNLTYRSVILGGHNVVGAMHDAVVSDITELIEQA